MVDVTDLKKFYGSAQGKVVAFEIEASLKELLGENKLSRHLFVGFGIPYAGRRERSLSLMLAHMGALAWPNPNENRAALAYEGAWPFADQEFDGIILVHALEYAQSPNELIDECHRCLKADGRLTVIVPNRRGAWAHSAKTPLGLGDSYGLTRLSSTLGERGFKVVKAKRALYRLPFSGFWGKVASFLFENLAKRCSLKFSGLIGVSAVKSVYVGIPVRKLSRMAKPAMAIRQGSVAADSFPESTGEPNP